MKTSSPTAINNFWVWLWDWFLEAIGHSEKKCDRLHGGKRTMSKVSYDGTYIAFCKECNKAWLKK